MLDQFTLAHGAALALVVAACYFMRNIAGPDKFATMSDIAWVVGAVLVVHAAVAFTFGMIPALVAVVLVCAAMIDVEETRRFLRHTFSKPRPTPVEETEETVPDSPVREPAGTASGLTAAEQDAWDALSRRLSDD